MCHLPRHPILPSQRLKLLATAREGLISAVDKAQRAGQQRTAEERRNGLREVGYLKEEAAALRDAMAKLERYQQ